MGMYHGAVKMLMLMLQKYSSLAIVLALIASCYSCEAVPISKIPPSASDNHPGAPDNHPGVPEYDHEAFWSKEGALEDLSPEESQSRLRQLANKIDRDGNGQVNKSELLDWILFTQQRYMHDDAEKQMKQLDTDHDGFVTWEEYKDMTYGFLDEDEDEDEGAVQDMLARDKKTFQAADADGDGKCDVKEFSIFLHPGNDDNLKSLAVEETFEDIDKDKDGGISLDEFIGDLWPEEEKENGDEPNWVKEEKENFQVHLDKDNDESLNSEEVYQWIFPEEFNYVEAEVNHLIVESDTNADGQLSIDEIASHFDLFVGSQATDFGEIFKKIGAKH